MSNDNDSGTVEKTGVSDSTPNENNEPQEQIETQESKPKSVTYETYKRVSNDMHKYKKGYREMESKIAELEEQRLAEKEEYKQLWEREKSEKEKWKNTAQSNEDLFWNTQKYNAVQSAALELGLRPEAIKDLELLKLDEVVIEKTDSGRFTVHGAKEFVETVKKDRPYWFKSDVAPKVNSGGGSARPDTDGTITPQQIVQVERRYKRGEITQSEFQAYYERYLNQGKTNILNS